MRKGGSTQFIVNRSQLTNQDRIIRQRKVISNRVIGNPDVNAFVFSTCVPKWATQKETVEKSTKSNDETRFIQTVLHK